MGVLIFWWTEALLDEMFSGCCHLTLWHFLCFPEKNLLIWQIRFNTTGAGFLLCWSSCLQSTSCWLLSLLLYFEQHQEKISRVSWRQRKKRFYCVNYLEVKAGWDSTVLYRQESVILMSGEAGGYFSSYQLLLLCLNTSASTGSCEHHGHRLGSNLDSNCWTPLIQSYTVLWLIKSYISLFSLSLRVRIVRISLVLCFISYVPHSSHGDDG